MSDDGGGRTTVLVIIIESFKGTIFTIRQNSFEQKKVVKRRRMIREIRFYKSAFNLDF